eukprot:s856_g19.t3
MTLSVTTALLAPALQLGSVSVRWRQWARVNKASWWDLVGAGGFIYVSAALLGKCAGNQTVEEVPTTSPRTPRLVCGVQRSAQGLVPKRSRRDVRCRVLCPWRERRTFVSKVSAGSATGYVAMCTSAAELPFAHGMTSLLAHVGTLGASVASHRWPAARAAGLPATCRQAAAHAALVCSGMDPVYFSAGSVPLSLAWGWWLCSALSRHLDACSAPATSSANGAGASREGSTPADARANEAVEVLRCVAWGGHDELRALATGAGLTPAALAEALATSPATSAAVMPSHPRRRNRPQRRRGPAEAGSPPAVPEASGNVVPAVDGTYTTEAPRATRGAIGRQAWQDLHHIDVQAELRQPSPFLQAGVRRALVFALQAVRDADFGEGVGTGITPTRAWTLFMLRPRMLLARPGADRVVGRRMLHERVDRYEGATGLLCSPPCAAPPLTARTVRERRRRATRYANGGSPRAASCAKARSAARATCFPARWPATSLVVPMFTLGWAADHDAPFTTEFVDFVTDAVDLYADTRADSIDGFA